MSISSPQLRLTLSAVTDVGRVRTNNEDAFLAIDLGTQSTVTEQGALVSCDVGPRGVMLAVSDGMGGAAAGEVASALVLKTLEDTLVAGQGPTDTVLREAVELANRAVFDAARDQSRRGMGATLTAVLVQGTTAYIAAVGDSRAYLLRGDRFRQMTRDQSYVQVLLDAGLMNRAEAEASPMRNVILQSMGQQPSVQVALGRLELRRGDRLVVCSDGLTGHVKDDEIAMELRRTDVQLDAIARRLVEAALEGGGEDNITVIVAEVEGDALVRAPLPESVTQTFQVLSEFAPDLGAPKVPKAAEPAAAPSPAQFTQPAQAVSVQSNKNTVRLAILVVLVFLVAGALGAGALLFCRAP
jgi:serine/threonine protein phosphatase PrpC